MNRTSVAKPRRGVRALLGPAVLATSPLLYLAGDAVLRVHPARPLNVIGLLGFALVVAGVLALMSGLGETGSLLAQHFVNED